MSSPVDEVGYPHTGSDEIGALTLAHPHRRVEIPVDDVGTAQGRIETVRRMTKVGVRCGCPEPGVDANEQEPDVGSEEVFDRFVPEGLEFHPSEPGHEVLLLLLAFVVGVVAGSVVGHIDHRGELVDRLQNDLLDTLLECHLGKSTSLTAAEQPEIGDGPVD